MTSKAVTRVLCTLSLLIGALALGACAPPENDEPDTEPARERPAPNPLKNAYFGDLHIHTKHSFDAYLFSVRETPDAAYRFAKGETISHPSGYEIKLQTGALDFYAVTDHAMYMGLMPAMDDPESDVYDEPLAKELRELATGGTGAFQRAIESMGTGELDAIDSLGARTSAWKDIIEAAERHNEPGVFTTFIGYEYTASTAERGNLHRNVIFRGSSVPELPFSRVDSADPEDLWNWLDDARARGEEALSIPHNSNGSNGAMFELTRRDGSAMDAEYAEKRMRNEPVIELTQIKGTSEVHPLLSPNDEWADFEIFPYRIATELDSEPKGSYAREALMNGLVMEQDLGFNPFRFGFVAATDSHNAGGQPEEDDYQSKVGTADGTPQARGSVPLDGRVDGRVRIEPRLPAVWSVGSGRRLGRREHPRLALRRDAPQGDLCHVGAAHSRALLCRLRLRRRAGGAERHGAVGLRRRRADGRRSDGARRRGAEVPALGDARRGECAAAAVADRQGLARRSRRSLGGGVRRRLLGRPRAGSRSPIAAPTTGQR